MNKFNRYYVSPRIEAYELESERFIASSDQRSVVRFGNGEGDGGGWTISKSRNGDSPGGGEELL